MLILQTQNKNPESRRIPPYGMDVKPFVSKGNYFMEIWKDVKGFEGLYQVSNFGRVKSLARLSRYKRWDRDSQKIVPERILKYSTSRYQHTTLMKDGIRKDYLIHRLVAIAFIPNPLGLIQVNHKDGNKLNNSIDNLEWVTGSENVNHAYKLGLQSRGENHAKAKYSNEKVLSVLFDYHNGETNQKALSVKHGISKTHIHRIVNNKSRCL